MNYKITALFIFLMFTIGCGMTTMQKINTANESARSFTKIIMPRIDAQCAAEAGACVTKGVEKASCAGYKKCDKIRHTIYDIVNGIHVSASSAAVLNTIGKKDSVEDIMRKVMLALANAYDKANKAGFLK